MKTAIIAHSHPEFTLGGGELAAHRYFRHLRQQGQDAAYIGLMIHPEQTARFFPAGARVQQFGAHDYCFGCRGMDSFRMEHDNIEEEEALLSFLLSIDAEVYHFHHVWNIGAGTIRRLAAARPDARLALTLHDYTAICANHGQMVRTGSGSLCRQASTVRCAGCFPDRAPIEFVIRRQRLRELMDVFDQLISPSHFLAERFRDWGIDADRIAVLENGLPESGPPPPEDLETLDEKSHRFAYFGAASPTKGLNVLARAACLLDARPARSGSISIAVHGVTEQTFTDLWPDIPVSPSLVFKGRYEPEDAVALMRQTGWVVMPSVWWENAPVVIQEARAAGTPVLASDIGGMQEKVREFGATFRAGDPAELARTISDLAGNTSRLLEHKQRITPPLTVSDYDRAMHDLLHRQEGGERAVG